ncbi:hypothetical protein ACHHYP_09853 [Achlya hypogyna]|uniref:BAG domain-containing protein n=1 Tax=Achlya hypogyna TaxID=1202772 RepID=A0A1V9ZIN6_ACHHY|nr:hypothetical protein ACHHYP_09853 [Achlya hypogyna]
MTSTLPSPTKRLAAVASHIDRAQDMLVSRLITQRHAAVACLAATKWMTFAHRTRDHSARVKRAKQELAQYRYRVLEQAERLTQLLMDLDVIESAGSDIIRSERKQLVHRIQTLFDTADELTVKANRLVALGDIIFPQAPEPAESPAVVATTIDTASESTALEHPTPSDTPNSEPANEGNEGIPRYIDSLPLWTPPVRLQRVIDGVVLTVELPGVEPKNVDVSVSPNGHLQVTGFKLPTPDDFPLLLSHWRPVELRCGRFLVERQFPVDRFAVDLMRFRHLPTGEIQIVVPDQPQPPAPTPATFVHPYTGLCVF